MASTRTQIYLTAEQREAIDELTKRSGKSLAWIVREALNQYLEPTREALKADMQAILDRTFGSVPDLKIPSRRERDRYPAGIDLLDPDVDPRTARPVRKLH